MPDAQNGTVILYKNVPLTKDYINTLDFPSRIAQINYFTSKFNPLTLASNFKYIDVFNQRVTVAADIVNIDTYNYMRISNPEESYTIYAFIDSFDSNGANTSCIIHFTVDVFQTYMGMFEIGECLVKREHKDRWTLAGQPIPYSYPEHLNYGPEYQMLSKKTMISTPRNGCYVLVVSTEPITGDDESRQNIAYGIPSFLNYYILAMPYNDTQQTVNWGGNTYLTWQDMVRNFRVWPTEWLASVVACIPLTHCPVLNLVDDINTNPITGSVSTIAIPGYPYTANILKASNPTPEVGGYTHPTIGTYNYFESASTPFSAPSPGDSAGFSHESRLMYWPYSYCRVQAYTGENMTLKHEMLRPLDIDINIESSLATANTSRVYLRFYDGKNTTTGDVNAQLLVNSNINFPWVTERYQTWISQNQNKIGLETLGNVGNTALGIGGALSGNPTGLLQAGGGVTSLLSQFASIEDMKAVPNNAKGMGNNGNFSLISYLTFSGIEFANMCVSTNNLLQLSSVFIRYGYSTTENKIPDLHSRYYFNHLQAEEVTIRGQMRQDYINEIISAINHGITFWHGETSVNIGDYSLDNYEV